MDENYDSQSETDGLINEMKMKDVQASGIRRFTLTLKKATGIFLPLLLLYVAVCLTLLLIRGSKQPKLPFSPANEAVAYETRKFWNHEKTLYGSAPSKEVDAAWDDLLSGVNIRISRDDMILAGEELYAAAQTVNGDYVAVLGVYHQLHCLDALRKLVYKEYYFPNMTRQEWQDSTHHWGHCIDSLRRSAMCHVDVALYSTEWIASSKVSPSKRLRSNADIVCTNWELVEKWARARSLERHRFLLRPGPYENGTKDAEADEFA